MNLHPNSRANLKPMQRGDALSPFHGRPPKLTTILRRKLQDLSALKNKEGETVPMSRADIVVEALLSLATSDRNLKAIEMIFDRNDGKSFQQALEDALDNKLESLSKEEALNQLHNMRTAELQRQLDEDEINGEYFKLEKEISDAQNES